MTAQRKPTFRQQRTMKTISGRTPPKPPRSEVAQEQKKRKRISDDAIRESIIAHCQEAGPEGSVRPEAVAQHLYPKNWQTLLKRVRLFARQLAQSGQIVLLRKGEPIDPSESKGIIHMRIVSEVEAVPEESAQPDNE